jgi:hypothetical protein
MARLQQVIAPLMQKITQGLGFGGYGGYGQDMGGYGGDMGGMGMPTMEQLEQLRLQDPAVFKQLMDMTQMG